MSLVCKWLLIGDSLLVGFRILPHQENRAIVGNTAHGVIQTLDEDLKACPKGKVILSLGSNMMFNNFRKEEAMLLQIVERIEADGRELIIAPVPAKGKFLKRAEPFNRLFRTMKYRKLPQIPKHAMWKDDIHIRRKGYRIWLNFLDKNY